MHIPPRPHGVSVGALEGWLSGAPPLGALAASGRDQGVGPPRGGRRARVLYADSPPPPSPTTLEIGTEVPDHQRQRRPKANLLEPLEGQKMGYVAFM